MRTRTRSQKTRCGATLNKLRVGADPTVVQVAGDLMRKWRGVAERAGAKHGSGSSTNVSHAPKPVTQALPTKPGVPAARSTPTPAAASSLSASSLPRLPGARHNARKAFIDLLVKATAAVTSGPSARAFAGEKADPSPRPVTGTATAGSPAAAAASPGGAGCGGSGSDVGFEVTAAEALAHCERVGSDLEAALFEALGGGVSGEGKPMPE